MYYNICYEVAALVILVALMITKYKYFKSENNVIKLFMVVSVMVAVTCITNITAALCFSNVIPTSDQMMLLVETVYLILTTLCCYMQLVVIEQRFMEHSSRIRMINFVLIAIMIIALTVNLSNHFIYEYVNHVFTRNIWFNFIYIVTAAMFAEMGVIIVINRKKVRRETFILTSSIMILPILCIFIQFFDDRYLVSEFGATIAFLIYSYSVEDQDHERLQKTLEELEESRQSEIRTREEITNVNRVKTLFMKNISEELRLPVREVLNVNTELKNKTDDDIVNDFTQKIEEAGTQLLDFVDELIKETDKEDVYEI